jgi:hypothetical protein
METEKGRKEPTNQPKVVRPFPSVYLSRETNHESEFQMIKRDFHCAQ